MRLFLTIFVFLLFTATASGQSALDSVFNTNDHIEGERLLGFVDSLKKAILADTSNFNRSDLKHTAIGTFNTKPYSKLYIINSRYSYKLDIIEPKQVLEFVNEVLDGRKVKQILLLDGHIASPYFGTHAGNGAVVITLTDGAKFNPRIGGLIKKSDNNFGQRRKGELMIRE
jgi:hypothetical protein